MISNEFSDCIYHWNYHLKQDAEHLHSSKKLPCTDFQSTLHSSIPVAEYFDFYYYN